MMLDNQAKIAALDAQGMLKCVENAPGFMDWCLNTYELDESVNLDVKLKNFLPSDIKSIFISGMGGSAISGDLVHDWVKDDIKLPVLVLRGYHLPTYIDDGWVGFFLSYSGMTEETLSSYVDAKKRGIKCVVVVSGGLLEEWAGKSGDLCFKVPGGFQPRAALLYLFTTLGIVLAHCGFMDAATMITDLKEAAGVLKALTGKYGRSVPVSKNKAKKDALTIHGTTPVIYGFDFYQSVARRFKCQFNENGKNPAYWDVFSELNHNEAVGWEVATKVSKMFTCLFLRDPSAESAPVTTRIEFMKNLVGEKAKAIIEVTPEGTSRVARMLSLVYWADFTSVYLAFANGADPTPVKSIQGLKDELGKRLNLQKQLTEQFEDLLSEEPVR
jgi:glucose/mannose-6-phosphate isomerase